MEVLYETLSNNRFISNHEAIEFCRECCLEYGFNIKLESSQSNIYICCSENKSTNCPWKTRLTKDASDRWIFMSQPEIQHNHLLSPIKIDPWPQQVYDRINQLASYVSPSEIRETIKRQFPDITWNNRQFYNCLMDEQRIVNRVKRLILASTRLCSVVVANEDWSNCVENDLLKLLDSFGRHQAVVDLDIDKIHSDIDKKSYQPSPMPRKRKAVDPNAKVVSVPSCILYVRSQPLRHEAPSRRAYTQPSSVYSEMTPLVAFQAPENIDMMNYGSQCFNTQYSNNNMNFHFNPIMNNYQQQTRHYPTTQCYSMPIQYNRCVSAVQQEHLQPTGNTSSDNTYMNMNSSQFW